MKDQMYNFNIEPVRHNQMEMLEMPNTVTEMKNAQQQKQDKVSNSCGLIPKVLMEVQSKFQKEKEEEIVEEIIAENFLKLMTDTKPQKQAAQKHHGG